MRYLGARKNAMPGGLTAGPNFLQNEFYLCSVVFIAYFRFLGYYAGV